MGWHWLNTKLSMPSVDVKIASTSTRPMVTSTLLNSCQVSYWSSVKSVLLSLQSGNGWLQSAQVLYWRSFCFSRHSSNESSGSSGHWVIFISGFHPLILGNTQQIKFPRFLPCRPIMLIIRPWAQQSRFNRIRTQPHLTVTNAGSGVVVIWDSYLGTRYYL